MQCNQRETVDYEVDDGIARIYLNRPHRLNATVPQLVEDLCQTLDEVEQSGVGAAILSGRGRAFCAGHDLHYEGPPITEAEDRRQLQRVQDVTRKVRQAPYAVIAAVHGYALGSGCEFALCSDFIIAASGAKFGFPEVGVGRTVTGGISHVLPITVGLARAKELVLLGQPFGAEQAKQLGLINWVVDAEKLESTALEIARTLCERPRLALSLAKFALDHGAQSDIGAAYEVEIGHAILTHQSDDARRATETFRRRSASSVGEER